MLADPQLNAGAAGNGLVGELADRLWEAEVGRRPIAPLTDTYGDLSVEDA
jgi:2-keto-4-pentenoate hydratase